MYDKGIVALGSITGVSSVSTLGAQGIWLFLGAVALLAAGLAVLRVVPRRQA